MLHSPKSSDRMADKRYNFLRNDKCLTSSYPFYPFLSNLTINYKIPNETLHSVPTCDLQFLQQKNIQSKCHLVTILPLLETLAEHGRK